MKVAIHIHLLTRLKNEWSYTSSPTCAFMACTETTLTLNLLYLMVFFYFGAEAQRGRRLPHSRGFYEGWNFNSGNYLFTTDTK